MPTKQQQKQSFHPSWDVGHCNSYISLHTLYSTVSNSLTSANPNLNMDICCLSNESCCKNTILVHFIHSVSFPCTWVCTYYTSVKDMNKQAHHCQRGDMLEKLVKYSSKFIFPSQPFMSSTRSSDKHTWLNLYRLILKWAFGSFWLKYCSDILYKKGRKAT